MDSGLGETDGDGARLVVCGLEIATARMIAERFIVYFVRVFRVIESYSRDYRYRDFGRRSAQDRRTTKKLIAMSNV